MPNSTNIRCLIWRVSSNCRIRHWHGRGVHSPTAYRFTREVFVRRRRLPRQGSLYSLLIEKGFGRSISGILQATYIHFGCGSCHISGTASISEVLQSDSEAPAMYVIPSTTDNDTLSYITEQARKKQSIICLITPRSTIKWYNTCLTITKRHEGMSIDCRNMIMLLNMGRINREHIKL